MSRPLLLDLFCGAGGAAMGYHRAGFDVVGVDINPQPRYPFEFHQADALTFPLDGFDAIHASPPCQAFTRARVMRPGSIHADLLTPMRERLATLVFIPWVIENVAGAPMRPDYRLCGCQFALGADDGQLRRERWFETSWHGFDLRSPCVHVGLSIPVFGHNTCQNYRKRWGRSWNADQQRRAMGIDWMNRNELSQAIPPAFTEFIGGQVLNAIGAVL